MITFEKVETESELKFDDVDIDYETSSDTTENRDTSVLRNQR